MKESFWNLFEAAVNIYESFNLFFFIFVFLGYNFRSKKNKIRYICGALFHTCIIFIFNAFMAYEGFWAIIYMSFTLIYAIVCIQRSITKTFFTVMLGYIWVLSVNAFVSVFISNISASDITAIYTKHNIERLIMVLTVQLIVTYAYRITLKIFKKGSIKLQFQEWMLILIVFILSFVIIMTIHIVQLNCSLSALYDNLLQAAILGIILINIACYYMVVRLSKANSIKIEHEILLAESNYRKHYAENAKNQYEEIRRIRHDMKQSYNVISQFVADEHYDKLKEYLLQMNNLINSISSAITTNNDVVNAILNTKLSTAKSNGIKTLCNTIKDMHIKQIEEIDLCHLIGNLLDNAIEAAVKCTNDHTKYIEISITEHKNIFMIKVKNSYVQGTLNPKFKTSKLNKINHGFGIKTIKKIANKYNGFADFYTEDDLFCCNVMIPIKQNENG